MDSSGHPIPPALVPQSPDDIHVLILDSTGFDVATSEVSAPAAPGTLCPQGLAFTDYQQMPAIQRIELGQGTLEPLNFFFSADNTELYLVNSTSSSILIYSFINGSVIGGIPLQNNAVPLTADMSADAGTIVIAGSDGLLHEVSTGIGGSDSIPISFPNITNFLNPFCSFNPGGIPCTLNVAQAKP
jgi:DNA-binding beta-propeller fold protein YncE